MTMLSRPNLHVKMVQALTILSALQLFSEAQKQAMTPCDGGNGVLRYERMADVQLDISSQNTKTLSFAMTPADVLFKCQNYCLNDQVNNSPSQECNSLDFIPGERFSRQTMYTESKCLLSFPSDSPTTLPQYRKADNYYHFREVCYKGDGAEKPRVATECPERLYVAERVMGKRFIPKGTKDVHASTLEECEQICLNQAAEKDPLMATSICRAGTFDHQRARCYLSSFTRRTHPHEFIDDTIYDYFENTCLDVERRCPQNKLIWTMEENIEMVGPYDFLLFANLTLAACQNKCLTNPNIFCRSLEYDGRTKTCILSDEDSTSRMNSIRQSLSDQNVYLELRCIDGEYNEQENALSQAGVQNIDRQPLSDRNMREVHTAFQLFRNRRLELSAGFRETGREGSMVSLAECLDACLEERSFQCRSVIYSAKLKSCRLSEFDRINGNLVMDREYDYYENMISGTNREDSSFRGSRPIDFGVIPGRFQPTGGDDRFISGGGFGSGFSGGGSRVDSFGSDRRFSSGSRFGDSFGGADRRNNRFGGSEDRFAGAFDRFHESSFGNSVGSDSLSGSRFGLANRDRFGASGGAVSGDNNRFRGTDRFTGSGFMEGSGFGNTGGFGSRVGGGSRVTGVDRFAGGSNRFAGSGSGGLVSSGADVGAFGGGTLGGGGSRFGSGNRFGGGFSDTGSSSFFGSSFGSSSSFGPSSSSGFGSNTFGRPSQAGLVGGGIDNTFQVSQQCNPDGSMEFMLRSASPDGFRGRIYSYGYYDKCFYRGGGSSTNVLKISPPRGFPSCGTIRYGDTTTNIVVVQFADGVITSRDKRYNLTCTTVGPGDTVVTSAYIGSGLGAPIPIEYLPEESRLDSMVRLQILYSGRPTTTVAVGDPLTFRIESLAGRNLVSDIFATDVIARDLLTGRAIELIDSRGCPVQEDIFPALGRARSGEGLEARFGAFKIPNSNMIVFEARVRMCRRECEPAICNTRGRSNVLSMGKRRKRSADADDSSDDLSPANETQFRDYPEEEEERAQETELEEPPTSEDKPNLFGEEEAHLNEVIRVYMSEYEAEEFRNVESAPLAAGVCISPSEYYSLLSGLMVTGLCLMAALFIMALCYRKHRKLELKNAVADDSNPRHQSRSGFPGSHARTVSQPARYFPSMTDKGQSNFDIDARTASGGRFSDPSEPIYTDPTLFERAPKDTESTSAKL